MHISKREAESEAIRIAEAFIAANVREDRRWSWECGGAQRNAFSSGHKRRKTAIKWRVMVRWIPEGGGVFDGYGIVDVNIEAKEARWFE